MRRIWTVVVVVAALVAAACGSTDGELVLAGDGGSLPMAPVDETDAGGPAETTATTAAPADEPVADEPAPAPASFRFSLVTDVAAAGPIGALRAEGEVAADGDTRVVVDAGAASAETVVVDGALYQRSDHLADGAWVHLDTIPSSATDGATTSAADGELVLAGLTELGAEVEEVGADEVDGVAVTHHRSTFPLQDALESVALFGIQGEVDLAAQPGELAGDVRSDIYVDAEGLVRRVHTTTEQGTSTMDLFDFGADVAIEAPEAPLRLSELDPEQLQGIGAP